MTRASTFPHRFPLIFLALALLALAVFFAHDAPPAQANHKLATPTNLEVTPLTATSAKLTWDGPAASHQYDIGWREVNDHSVTGSTTSGASTGGGTHTLTAVLTGLTEYQFRIRTAASGGHTESDYTQWVTATTPWSLVSNIGQSAGTAKSTASNSHAQPFYARAAANLVSIEAVIGATLNAAQRDTVRAQLWSVDNDGAPDQKVADLVVPDTIAAGTLAFTAPPGTTLTAETHYAFVIHTTGNVNLQLGTTASDNEDAGAADLWTIANISANSSNVPGSSWSPSTDSLRIRVNGAEQVEESTVLVSNLGQTPHTSVSTDNYSLAQGFTTGAESGGYTLGSIDVVMEATNISSAQRDAIRAELWSTVASGANVGKPDSKLADLTVPAHPIATGTVKFTAPDNTTLTASTTYYAVFYTVGSFSMSLDITNSNDEDSGGAPGWSIADGIRDVEVDQPTSSSSWSGERGWSLLIRVNAPEAAVVADPLDLSGLTAEGSTDGSTFTDLAGANSLAPAFDADTTAYRATVANDVTHVRVTPTVAATSSIVLVGKSGGTLNQVTSGSASAAIELADGDTEITVQVNLSDLSDGQNYTVTVRRVPSGTEWHATLAPGEVTSGSDSVLGCNDSYTEDELKCSTASTLTENEFSVVGQDYGVREIADQVQSGQNILRVTLSARPNAALRGLTFCSGSNSYPISSSADGGQRSEVLWRNTDAGWTAGAPVSVSIGTSCTQDANADLSALTAEDSADGNTWAALSGANALSPAFYAGTTGYRATVANSITHVRLTPTVAVTGSTVKVGKAGTTLATVTSGSPSAGIALAAGDNEITVEVTASDGSTTKNYTVTVRRVPSGTEWHATLLPQDLGALGEGCHNGSSDDANKCSTETTLTDDDFTHDSTTYALTTVRVTSTLFLVFDTAPTTATKALNFCVGESEFALSGASGTSVSFGSAGLTWTAGVPVSLSLGTQCEPPDATALSALTGEGSTDGSTFSDLSGANALAPAFDAETTGYRATVGNTITHVRLTPTVEVTGSTVKVGKAGATLAPVTSGSPSAGIELAVGDNQITVEVTASDSTTKDYTVTVRRVPTGTEWWATLVPHDLPVGATNFGIGCYTGGSDPSAACTASGTLNSANSFTLGATTYNIFSARINSGILIFAATETFGNDLKALNFCVGSTSFAISGATGGTATWSNTGLTWTVGVPVSLSIGTACAQQTTSSNANLGSLTASSSDSASGTFNAVTLSPAFDKATTSYTATVANNQSHAKLTPTVEDTGKATVTWRKGSTGDFTTVTSGSATTAISLDVGANEITVQVTAEDSSTQDYTVTITRQRSANANLSNLTASSSDSATGTFNAVTLSPSPFAPATTSYTASVANGQTHAKLTPTVADTGKATVAWRKGTTGAFTTVASGSATTAISLDVGQNAITVRVTAEDTTTTKNYTVTITRRTTTPTLSSNANLGGLTASSSDSATGTFNAVSLSPAFAAATTSYSATVANSQTHAKLTPTVADTGKATVAWRKGSTGNFTTVTDTQATAAIPLDVGGNTITVRVTAEDSGTRDYTVTITRRTTATLSSNANLSNLTASSSDSASGTFRALTGANALAPAFAAATTTYTATVANNQTHAKLTPTVADTGKATVAWRKGTTGNFTTVTDGTATTAISLDVGQNAITVRVTAEDSSTRDYTVTITRSAPTVTPTVSLSASPNPVDEGSSVTITATLSQALDRSVVIPLDVSSGTAEPADHGTLASITITSGATAGTGTIATAHDMGEDHETFTVSLGVLPSGIEAGSPSSVQVTIRDDEAPVPVWEATLTVASARPSHNVVGCDNSSSSGAGVFCSTADVLTDDDFNYDEADYAVIAITLSAAGDLYIRLNKAIPAEVQGSLVLTIDGARFPLTLAALQQQRSAALWSQTGLAWSAGDTVQLSLIELPIDVAYWKPTFNVGWAGGDTRGCRNGVEGAECSAEGTLSRDGFRYIRTLPDYPGGQDARTYRVRELYRTDGNQRNELVLVASDQFGQALAYGLVLTVLDPRNRNTVPLRFPVNEARRNGHELRWTYDGTPWFPHPSYGSVATTVTLALERPRAGLNSIDVHYDGITDDHPGGVDEWRHSFLAYPTTYGYVVNLPGEFPSIRRDYENNPVITTHARLRIHPQNPGSTVRVGKVRFNNNAGWTAHSFQAVTAGALSHNIELDKTNIYTHVSIEVTDGGVVKTYWLAIDPPPRTYRLTPQARVVEGQAASLTLTLSEAAPAGGAQFTVTPGYGTATADDLGAIASPVTVTEGNTTVAISIPTVDDEQYEGEESFTVSVAPARFGWGPDPDATDTATVTIQDNDPAPTGPEPRSVRVVPGDSSLTVSWTVAPREGVEDGDIRHALRWSQESGVWANPKDPKNVGKNDGVTVAGGVTSYLITGLKNDVATGVFVRSYTGKRHDEQSPDSSQWVRVKGEHTTPRGEEEQQQQDTPNRAPTVSGAIADLTIVNQTGARQVSLSGVFNDEDGDDLTITASSSDQAVASALAATDNSSLTVTAQGKGTATITATAKDGKGGTVDDTFTVTVKAAPTVSAGLSDVTGLEVDATKDISLAGVFADPDGDALYMAVTSSDDAVAGGFALDGTLTILALSEGTATITVTAEDTDGNTVSDTFDVSVVPAPNQAPTVSSTIADATIVNASGTKQVSLSGVFSDADNDALTLTAASSNAAVAAVSVATDSSSLTVTAQARGAATITVTAKDGNGGTVDDTFTVTVKAAPVVAAALADVTGLVVGDTQDVSLSGVFRDADGDRLTITAASSDETKATVSVASDGSKLTLSGVAEGATTITVTARDSDGNTVSDAFDVSVEPEPAEAEPGAPTVVSPLADLSLEVAKYRLVSLSGVFRDPDGDDLTITASASDYSVVSTSKSGSMLIVVGKSEGRATITVTAEDDDGNTVSDQFEVTVRPAS